ncbi:class I SAM-dependent methyltransferase [Cupriavidus sp. DF5525]|uniref:class I SAM-dependent methyltransferase n=1 Tax=Cupriavidus sp. DF5525 TaxID=3160989 RepID=UPI0032E02A57
MNWSDGYFTGLTYTHGYYSQLNPLQIRMACLAGGFEPPMAGEEFHYLELGYGQGISINIHASANEGSFWGTDFNPAHAAGARALAYASGAKASLHDDSFQDFLARPDLPEFDVVSLHGIWSWISEENRELILKLVRTKLKVGGAVLVSYNCLPGWAPLIPIRELLAVCAERHERGASQEEAVVRCIEFARNILEAQPVYLADNPVAAQYIGKLKNGEFSPNYIAHEFLNRDWKLASFADVATAMERAKLSFAASARLLSNIDAFRITDTGLRTLEAIGDPVLRESARDYMVNERFRSDIFIKGLRRIPMPELHDRWCNERFVMTTAREDLPKEVLIPLGHVSLQDTIPSTIADLLCQDEYRPKTVSEMLASPVLAGVAFDDVVRAIIVLVGAGYVSPAQLPTALTMERSRQFNRYVLRRALATTELEYLASPVTGGGVHVPQICQLFILALERGIRSSSGMAAFVWETLERIGEKIKKDGRRLDTREESIACIEPLAEVFTRKHLPVFMALIAL